jgi:hypothetical protein
MQVKDLEPSVATASSQLVQARVEGETDTRIHLATHGHQDLGSFVNDVLSHNGVVELQVDCSCHSAGLATFEVMFLFEGSSVLTPSFAFRKSCRSDLMGGLDVGTIPHGNDVVKDGGPRWLPSRMPLISITQSALVLYVTSRSSSAQWRSFQFPSVRALGQKGIVETKIESAFGGDRGMLDFGHSMAIKVTFQCLKSSLAALELTLIPQHPWDPFQPMSITFEKDCRKSYKPHLEVGAFQARARVKKQLDTRPPVLVRSSFGESASVFGAGQTLPAWEVMNPSVSLAPENNVVVFSVERNTAMPSGSTLSVLPPKIHVSNDRILDVVMSQEADRVDTGKHVSFLGNSAVGYSPVVLIARHVCKDLGLAKVTVTLPIHKSSSDDSTEPITFSYRKACHRPIKSMGTYFLELQTLSQWDLPTGGWRIFIFVIIGIVVVVLFHEFGHVYLGYKMKTYFENVKGPELFGVQCTVGELTFKPWSGAFILEDLTLMNPPGYTGEILLKAHRITLLGAVRKAIFSLGRLAEIRSLQLKHVDIHIELDNVVNPFSGGSNLRVVGDHARKVLAEKAEIEKREKEQGVKSSIWHQATDMHVNRALTNVTLDEVELQDIQCTCSFVSYPSLGGAELNIEDIHYHNFSEQFNVYGSSAVLTQLGKVVKGAVSEKFLGSTGNEMANKVSSAATKAKTSAMKAKTMAGEKVQSAKAIGRGRGRSPSGPQSESDDGHVELKSQQSSRMC